MGLPVHRVPPCRRACLPRDNEIRVCVPGHFQVAAARAPTRPRALHTLRRGSRKPHPREELRQYGRPCQPARSSRYRSARSQASWNVRSIAKKSSQPVRSAFPSATKFAQNVKRDVLIKDCIERIDHMKFSVSMYSYMQKIRSGEATPFELNREDQRNSALMPLSLSISPISAPAPRKSVSPTPKSSARNAERVGLEISALVVSCDFITGSDGDLDKEIARVKDYVDIAHVLGVTVCATMQPLAMHATPVTSARLIQCSRASQRPARKSRSTLHSSASAPWSKTTASMCRIPSVSRSSTQRSTTKTSASLTDMGNFLCADEDPASAFARVAPYAYYVHAKDFIVKPFTDADPGEGSFRSRGGKYLRGTIVGHGNVPIKQCMYQLKRAGYDDCISIEFEGMEPVFDALRIGLANLEVLGWGLIPLYPKTWFKVWASCLFGTEPFLSPLTGDVISHVISPWN